MDGSNAAFLLDTALFSQRDHATSNGILYIEDFDVDVVKNANTAPSEPPPPSYTGTELAAAREDGRRDGLLSALADARLTQVQLQAAVTQSLADSLTAAHAMLREQANSHAGMVSRTILSILNAAIPAAMREHAGEEVHALVTALAPSLTCLPELRVYAHPDLADFVRELLFALLSSDTCILSVCADSALLTGDIRLSWLDGRVVRDCNAIWSLITAALHPLGLPTFQEICHGCGS